MHVVDCVQRDADWLQEHLGRVTSARIDDAVAVLSRKEGESKARYRLRMDLVSEMLTGRVAENYVSYWMERGIELEPDARAEYEFQSGLITDVVGFVIHPANPRFGASPDCLVIDDGLAEFKCPKNTTHLGYIDTEVIPEEYQKQMQWQMACTERSWCDFVSYCPDMPDNIRLFVKRLTRDEVEIAKLEAGAEKFLAEVDETIAKIRSRHA